MPPPDARSPAAPVETSRSRFKRWARKLWWLHSFGALSFGVGVMIFARKGLAYADKLLLVLAASWLLVFVALRFIVGPQNTKPDEKLARKGLRLVTNYVIKNLYQQMFFFLTPLYASSATWTLDSPNWWIAPVLLICAVLSTLDLVFDHFIMERRASSACSTSCCRWSPTSPTSRRCWWPPAAPRPRWRCSAFRCAAWPVRAASSRWPAPRACSSPAPSGGPI
jgi:hypothetical protein